MSARSRRPSMLRRLSDLFSSGPRSAYGPVDAEEQLYEEMAEKAQKERRPSMIGRLRQLLSHRQKETDLMAPTLEWREREPAPVRRASWFRRLSQKRRSRAHVQLVLAL